MVVLIHDIKNLPEQAIKYFEKFKDLKLVYEQLAKDNMKNYWKNTKTIIDSTANHEFYNKCKENNEERKFSKEVDFVKLNGREIVKVENLRNYFYKKANFNEDDYEVIKHKRQVIDKTLEQICSSFQNQLEKELEELSGKHISLKNLTPDNTEVYFISEKNGESTNVENVLNIEDFLVLKELKDILTCKL